jgi:hypothetical protein
MSAGEPIACSLSGGEMAERQVELRQIFSGRVAHRSREGNALRIELHDSPRTRERLARVVELERACCPFLDIDLGRHEERLVLRIDGPPDAAAVIDGFEELTR